MQSKIDIHVLVEDLLRGLKGVFVEKMVAVYFYGAALLPDSLLSGDIDFHVIVKTKLSKKEIVAINSLYSRLKNIYAAVLPDLDFDGYYILLQSAKMSEPPVHLLDPKMSDEAWALHRAHILAGQCLVAYGPDPETILMPPDWTELETALLSELKYVEKNLTKYPDYCILNLCRIMFSIHTREVVVSKAEAAKWAWDSFPVWRKHIDYAKKSYSGNASSVEKRFMAYEVKKLYKFASWHIEKDRSS
ncbi:MAG: DUF4111 domain-containing protein [Anaerolineaceae bacterium]|nr:DUF4111 domain-containing protein [Anaerolineaceae bacterium]